MRLTQRFMVGTMVTTLLSLLVAGAACNGTYSWSRSKGFHYEADLSSKSRRRPDGREAGGLTEAEKQARWEEDRNADFLSGKGFRGQRPQD